MIFFESSPSTFASLVSLLLEFIEGPASSSRKARGCRVKAGFVTGVASVVTIEPFGDANAKNDDAATRQMINRITFILESSQPSHLIHHLLSNCENFVNHRLIRTSRFCRS